MPDEVTRLGGTQPAPAQDLKDEPVPPGLIDKWLVRARILGSVSRGTVAGVTVELLRFFLDTWNTPASPTLEEWRSKQPDLAAKEAKVP
jgi:hypothetical protein